MNKLLIDMTGQKFGKLTVLYKSENRKSPSGNIVTRWHCKCDCGNELDVDAYAIRSGNTKSCGCEKYRKNYKDISGNTYGMLKVIRFDKIENRKSYWLCKCKCGNEIVVPKCNLLNNNTKSCGCVYSYGEALMEKIFNKYNIEHKHNYRFSDLHGPNNGQLIFDYALLNNGELSCLIEFQGIQHYIDTDFGRQQREITDKIKKEYCDKKDIPLYYIRYNENVEYAILNILLMCMSTPCQAPQGEGVTTIPQGST